MQFTSIPANDPARNTESVAEYARWKARDFIDTAKTFVMANDEHPLRVIKQQISFQKTRLRSMVKNLCKVTVIAALTNTFLARRLLFMAT